VYAHVEGELQRAERPIWITGHSLGGALAVLTAWMFLRRTVNVHQVYTYGGPMVGNAEAMRAFEAELKGKIFRYVDTIDLVPKLPTVSLIANAFGHCPQEKVLGAIEQAAAAPAKAASAIDVLASFAKGSVDGLLKGTLIDEVWRAVQSRVDAHMMTNYRAKIGK
jgi:hypothetical protein